MEKVIERRYYLNSEISTSFNSLKGGHCHLLQIVALETLLKLSGSSREPAALQAGEPEQLEPKQFKYASSEINSSTSNGFLFFISLRRKMGLRFFVILLLLGLTISTLSVDAKSLKGKRNLMRRISNWSHCGLKKMSAINAGESESRNISCAFIYLESISTQLNCISLCHGWINSTS